MPNSSDNINYDSIQKCTYSRASLTTTFLVWTQSSVKACIVTDRSILKLHVFPVNIQTGISDHFNDFQIEQEKPLGYNEAPYRVSLEAAMKLAVTVFVVLTLSVLFTDGWLFRRRRRSNRCGGWWWKRHKCTSDLCNDPSRGKPYYFGTTNLWCIKKGKRASHPTRPGLALSHRWILFDGYYFERLKNGGDVYHEGYSVDSDRCSTSREAQPAGYSNLTVSCIQGCTRNYRRVFGGYRLLRNNCHDFANKISQVLCTSTTCPDWCK